MAVNVNLITADELIAALDLDKTMIAKAKAASIMMEIKLTAIEISSPGGGTVSIPIKMASLSELAAGKAAPILKQALQTSVTAAYEKAIAKIEAGAWTAGQAVAEEENPFEFGPAGKPAKAMGQPMTGDTIKAYKAFDDGQPSAAIGKGKWHVLNAEQINGMLPVALSSANALYQPVSGTSKNSKYFAVALKDDLKVAARIKGGALSVRVEGSGYSKYKAMLGDCEFTVHNDYASIHLDCNGSKLAARALGALICSMNVHFETPPPVLKMIGG